MQPYNNNLFTYYLSSPVLAPVLRDEFDAAERFILSGDYSPFNEANPESESQSSEFLPLPNELAPVDNIDIFFEDFSEIHSTHRSSQSRSSSHPRDETLQDTLESSSAGSPRKLKRNNSNSSSSVSVNSKRQYSHSSSPDDALDFPEPTKSIKRVQRQPTSGEYPSFTADSLVDDILSLTKPRKPSDSITYPLDLPTIWQPSTQAPEDFFEFTEQDQPIELSTTIISDQDTTPTSGGDQANLKQLVKNYISTISQAFATIVLEQIRDETSEIFGIIRLLVSKALPSLDETGLRRNIESVEIYVRTYIEGKKPKTTNSGNSWRQYKVNNKEEILEKFHPQVGDDSYRIAIKRVVRELIGEFFSTRSYLYWAETVYKAKKEINREFYKNKNNIREIRKVFISAEKWKSKFEAPRF